MSNSFVKSLLRIIIMQKKQHVKSQNAYDQPSTSRGIYIHNDDDQPEQPDLHKDPLATPLNKPFVDKFEDKSTFETLPSTSKKIKEESSIDIEYDPLIKQDFVKKKPSDLHDTTREETGSDSINSNHRTVQPKKRSNILLKCSYCKTFFPNTSRFHSHSRVQTGATPSVCLRCSKSFAQSRSLKYRLHTHTGDKLLKCPYCDRSFTRLSNLRAHLKIYSDDKLHCNKRLTQAFKCSQCNKSFGRSRNLRIHTGEKPYKCSRCVKTFELAIDLKNHLLAEPSHNLYDCSLVQAAAVKNMAGDKPFKCTHCEKSFEQSNDLTVHVRDQPFECSHRYKSFAQRSDLTDHLAIQSCEKPFKCSYCRQTFEESSTLNHHVSRVHKSLLNGEVPKEDIREEVPSIKLEPTILE